ncbi:MAG TPA: AmmeMemoRadiSam system protein A [Candidatus Humimicrobiaceae bacterium]|nr:AmmeMemoRadiSam system protein A [Candidatus Humimicrobiaceae bacterium]
MNWYVSLAKSAVERYIKKGETIEMPEGLPEELLGRKAGTFVTIEKEGQLRGCIGTYLPTRASIAEEIIRNAIAAASEDDRFGSITTEELPRLSYTVYILSYPEPAKDIKELDAKKFGIIVKSQGFSSGSDVIFNTAPKSYQKTGLLLPDLEGIDNVEKQFSIACQKGGIDPQKEKIFIYRFTVEKYQ